MEDPIQFTYNNKRLYGILHVFDEIHENKTIVIVLTGGPQVRIGSHRLYVLLSRFLSKNHWSSFRFDYEGLGDSEGDFVGFQYAGPSITAAINFLQNRFKGKLDFILWSLCDGAAAAADYAAMHPEHISGLILCNPMAATDKGLARSKLFHYYGKRFFKKEFLKKIMCFELDIKSSVQLIYQYLQQAQFFKPQNKISNSVLDSLVIFEKPIRIILSTDDVIANNFKDQLNKNKVLKRKQKKISNFIIKGADHTFTDPKATQELFATTLKALNDIKSLDFE